MSLPSPASANARTQVQLLWPRWTLDFSETALCSSSLPQANGCFCDAAAAFDVMIGPQRRSCWFEEKLLLKLLLPSQTAQKLLQFFLFFY